MTHTHARCDECADWNEDCPGDEGHCLAGEHCTRQWRSCRLDAAMSDHRPVCCSCGADLWPAA